MGKTIYWIDDDVQQMISIMQGVFPTLWDLDQKDNENEAATKIIIFGNDFQDPPNKKLYSKREEIAFQHKLEDFLHQECIKRKRATWKTELYQSKSKLIENAVRILFKESDADEETTEAKDDELKFYRETREYWKSIGQKEKPESDRVEKLIQMMQLTEDAVVGIDLILLYKDIERAKAGKCIISMELYHQLQEKYTCFLYSSATFDRILIDSWKETYMNIYGAQDVRIYTKHELFEKRDKTVLESIMKTIAKSE